MTSHVSSLLTSFPWLTPTEAALVSQYLPCADAGKTASMQMQAIAIALDQAGLPPTSTLLLALAGRGSKATAVSVARAAGRARYEGAKKAAHQVPSNQRSNPTENLVVDEATVRGIIQSTVKAALALMSSAIEGETANERTLKAVEILSEDVRWLKSTIDTERQLRKYRELEGPLSEYQVNKLPPTAEARSEVVRQLSDSLERDRLTSHAPHEIDIADGRSE